MSNSGKASASADIKGANAGVKDRIILTTERVLCYIVLILITFLCLFSFYVLIINTTRSHPDIQKGFSFLPGKSFIVNMKNVLANENIPVIKGMFNSLFVAACSAVLSVYFSALTAFAIHAYNFRLKKFAFTFILLVMMVPTQVSALGFVKMIGDWKLLNSYIPLIVPSIAAPVVFFFIKQYMDSVLPMELIEAARIDGARELLINKASKKTLPLLIAQLRSADFLKFDMGQVYMMIAFAIVPVIIVYICLSKFIVRGVTLGGVKG